MHQTNQYAQPTFRAVYEEPVSAISAGAALFIWSVRQWLQSALSRRCVKRDLLAIHKRLGCTEAIAHLDELMCSLAMGSSRGLEIRPLLEERLSPDEQRLLRLLRFLQHRDSDGANSVAVSPVLPQFVRPVCDAALNYSLQLRRSDMDLCGLRRLELVGDTTA